WARGGARTRERFVFTGVLVVTALGIFMCGARLPVVMLLALLLGLVLSAGLRLRPLLGVAVVASVVGYVVATTERLQRFTTLQDTDFVRERVSGSLQLSFLSALGRYPLGAGLGSAAGTSIPYFLLDRALPQIGLENEYARIALEQTLLGLALWVGFIVWTLFSGGRWFRGDLLRRA